MKKIMKNRTPTHSNAHANAPDIFDNLREGFRFVAENAAHVTIHHDVIAAYAESLPASAPQNAFDDVHHYTGATEDTACYILALDSINFGSGYEPALLAEGWSLIDESLYFTLATHLKQYFESSGPLNAQALMAMDTEQCLEILHLPKDGAMSREFAALCARGMRELGADVAENHAGLFDSFVQAANGKSEDIVRRLITMHHFKDIHAYKGRDVAFYKRAQITAADLYLGYKQMGIDVFDDTDRLTMFADNAVPHVLRVDGLLSYTDSLAQKIAAEQDIKSGSEEEIELRACAAHVVELIAAHKGLRAMDIDHILWHKSVEAERYNQSPPHRTLSRFY
jgi:hypothetical protein